MSWIACTTTTEPTWWTAASPQHRLWRRCWGRTGEQRAGPRGGGQGLGWRAMIAPAEPALVLYTTVLFGLFLL